MMIRYLAAMAILITGCITVYSPPQAQQAASPDVATPQPVPQAPSEQEKLTIAETIQLCKAVQESSELPITCNVTYIESKPSMLVGFYDLRIATQYWGAMTQVVSGPFCIAANQASRQAFVLVVLTKGEMARLYSCETLEWSEWFSYSDKSF